MFNEFMQVCNDKYIHGTFDICIYMVMDTNNVCANLCGGSYCGVFQQQHYLLTGLVVKPEWTSPVNNIIIVVTNGRSRTS